MGGMLREEEGEELRQLGGALVGEALGLPSASTEEHRDIEGNSNLSLIF